MKILLVSHSQKIGGAEKCLFELATGLINKKNQVYVVLPSKNENYHLFDEIGCEIIIKSYPWWVSHESDKFTLYLKFRKLLSYIKGTFLFLKIIYKLNPEIIISNTICVPFGAIVSKILNKKHFWFIHELGYEDHNLKFDLGISFSCKIISFCSNKVFVNSEYVFNYYSDYINKSKLKIVNIDVPIDNFIIKNINKSESDVDLFIIGQIQPAKGQMDAILAHELLIKKQINSRLYIIGNPTNQEYYQHLISYIKNNCILNIRFFNHLENPFSFISNKSIGLICSDYEAFGRITIEYMKLKIPIIAKATGNNINLINDGNNGLLYYPKQITELVDKIIYLNNNIYEREMILEEAYKRVITKYDNVSFVNLIIEEF